ncbi:hypothetical protein BCEN4_110053 [Burkholderia cenocepacia]|nr:hypothetical protein BCEN4_110053 [Burkholderia cenocepacia]
MTTTIIPNHEISRKVFLDFIFDISLWQNFYLVKSQATHRI